MSREKPTGHKSLPAIHDPHIERKKSSLANGRTFFRVCDHNRMTILILPRIVGNTTSHH